MEAPGGQGQGRGWGTGPQGAGAARGRDSGQRPGRGDGAVGRDQGGGEWDHKGQRQRAGAAGGCDGTAKGWGQWAGAAGGAGDRAARGGDSGQGRGGSTTPCPAPLTPAQAEEAFADEAVPEAACHGHVGLPGLGEHPAEGRQEEEMQEGGHQRAHHLDRAAGWVRRGGCPVTRSQACPGGGAR